MSGKLRSINTKFWEDPWVETLSPKDKLLFLYLITNTKTNMLGIYEVSVSKISFETGLTKTEITKAFKGFERVNKAYHIDNFIILSNFLKNQKMNTNMLKSAKKEYENLPESLLEALSLNGSKGFETLTQGLGMLSKIEVEEEDEIESELEGESEIENIPALEEFLIYCNDVLKEKYEALEFSLSAKYDAWKDDGWKDGNKNKIKNWKTKIKNTIPYLKPMQNDTKPTEDRSSRIFALARGDHRNT